MGLILLNKFFDLSTPSPISSFGGTWWWTNSTIPPKNPPPYGTHVLLGNRQSYHYLVRHLLGKNTEKIKITLNENERFQKWFWKYKYLCLIFDVNCLPDINSFQRQEIDPYTPQIFCAEQDEAAVLCVLWKSTFR